MVEVSVAANPASERNLRLAMLLAGLGVLRGRFRRTFRSRDDNVIEGRGPEITSTVLGFQSRCRGQRAASQLVGRWTSGKLTVTCLGVHCA